jgi:ferrous iron transport protein B
VTIATRIPCVAIAGNPNTGKTTLFNRLTGARAKVGNYPGVTVERQIGSIELEGFGKVQVMDVPGTYSLSARSREEQLAIQAVAGLHPLEKPDVVVCVVDATQLVRNLYLVLQLIELDTPIVCALNMTDRLKVTGQSIDVKALKRALGVPVVPIVAPKGTGFEELRQAIGEVLKDPRKAHVDWPWESPEPLLEADVLTVGKEIPDDWVGGNERRRRALALWALLSVEEEDELDSIPEALRNLVARRRMLADASGRRIEEEIIRSRYGWLDAHSPGFLKESPQSLSLTDKIDRVLLNPTVGFALFIAFMTVLFQSIFAWADPLIGWIEVLFEWLGDTTVAVMPGGFFRDLLVQGLIAGVGGVLVFLPQILLLFFFIGLMEDTGYMTRIAYLMDRVMRLLGLHGRAFVPMLSGYACAVPAILATRTMERSRDRLLTMMVVPLMTCSARLPVYGLLIAAIIPPDHARPFTQGLLLTGMYLFSTLIALLAAGVLGRTVLKGSRVPFLMEMPPYRLPHWPSIVRMMWQRSSVFIREAGTIILACTVGMWFLLSYPKAPETESAQAPVTSPISSDEKAEHEIGGSDLRNSYAGRLGRSVEPILKPLGFDWKIGVGLIGAFAAREVFVSTMAVVYGLDDGEDETSHTLRSHIHEQRWPDGRVVYTPLVCFSLMAFFALACQCMSTVAVVKRETGSWRWPIFLFGYTTAMAWVASFAIYQGGTLLGF